MARILIGNIKPTLVNNALTTQAGLYALDAAMGKTLDEKIGKVNSDLAAQTLKLDMLHNLSLTDFVTDFDGGGNAICPGRWRVYNASGTAAHAPYTGSVGGYVDITISGDMTVTGSEAYQELHDANGDVYVKIIKAGTGYGTWKKLTP